jgi:hypothetical protein
MPSTKGVSCRLGSFCRGGESRALRGSLAAVAAALSVACGSDAVTMPQPPRPSPPPAAPSRQLSGSYEAVFTADAVCSDLPAVARSRTYSAVAGGQWLDLGGAVFGSAPPAYPTMNSLYVRIVEDFAYLYASDPPVIELPTSDTHLMIEGTAEGPVRDGTSELSFRGSFSYCAASTHVEGAFYGCLVNTISCRSENHRLTLTQK